MINPFVKRATEHLRNEEAFLSVVSPEPVTYFLVPHGSTGALYDRLVIIRGSPGSGKTTLARLFEFPVLVALLRNTSIDTFRTLLAALTEAGAIVDCQPRVLGCRIPLETDYRGFWEFPYPDELKTGLMAALVQARAMLGWMRSLTEGGYSSSQIEIVPRSHSEAAFAAIGGRRAADVVDRARAVEASIYQIVNALVAPSITEIDADATGAYRPFDVVDRVRIVDKRFSQGRLELLPVVILDDAHTLHPQQFRAMQHWLAKRELQVARWILTRLDVLHPGEAIAVVTEDRTDGMELPGVAARRDTTEILLQSGEKDRKANRMTFRRMA